MSIPSLPKFESFLASLSLTEPPDSQVFESVVAVEPVVAWDRDTPTKVPGHVLWYKPVEDLTLDSVVRKVQKELAGRGHVDDRDTVMCVLCLFTLCRTQNSKAVERFNEILDLVVDGDLTQIFIFPARPPENYGSFEVGSFKIGKLDAERLAYRSRRARSNYFDRYADKIRGCLSIERDVVQTKIVDWSKAVVYPDGFSASTDPAERQGTTSYLLVDTYFNRVSRALFVQFFEQLEADQVLAVAAGGGYVDSVAVRLVPSSSTVSLFMNVGTKRQGWVVPHGTVVGLDLSGTDKTIPRAQRLLADHGVDRTNNSHLHNTLMTFGRYVARARTHRWAKRTDEAFLHFVIALDLLLGDRSAVTQKVVGRTAVLVHRHFRRGLGDQKKAIERLYDLRSRYVHQGQSVQESDVQNGEDISREVFMCLIRLYRKKGNHEPGFIEQWLKNIDYIGSALEANKIVSGAEYADNGIAL